MISKAYTYKFISFFIILMLSFSGGLCNPASDNQKLMQGCETESALKIYIDPSYPLKQAVLSDFLSQIEAVTPYCLVNKEVKEGINLLHGNNVGIRRLESQEFYIEIEGEVAKIAANTEDSSQRAIYYLLNQLGFEFLWYSDAWTIRPKEITFNKLSAKFISPTINSLYYGGTGGTNPYNEQSALVSQYKRRNYWQYGDYSPVSHALHSFYKNKKKKIEQYQKQGKVIFFDFNKKKKNLNLDQPETLELLKEFFLEQLEANPSLTQLSVSPFDGLRDDTLPKTIPQVTNPGEKHWWWINEVAKEIEKKYPEVTVKVNAYGNGKYHVQPPSFKMTKNILVQIAPDAFQRHYQDRFEMYNDWKNKGEEDGFNKFFYRGYLNITQWSKGGLPRINQDIEVIQFIEDLNQMNLVGMKLESTHFVIMSPHLYVLSKKLTGYTSLSSNELYDQYYNIAFPKSKMHIKRMTDRWFYRNFQGEIELPNALKDIEQAYYYSDAGEEEKARLREIMVYLHYLSLYYHAAKKNTVESAVEMEKYALSVSDYGILQTKAVVYYDYGNVKPYKYKQSPLLKQKNLVIPQISESQILADFQTDLKKYPQIIQKVETSFINENVKPISTNQVYTVKLYKKNNAIEVIPQNNEPIKFTLNTARPGFELTITDENGMAVFKKNITEETNEVTFTYHLKKDKKYRVEFNRHTTFITINLDGIIFNQDVNPRPGNKYNRYYLYVPEDAEEIIYKGKYNEKISFLVPTNNGFKKVEPQLIYDGIYKIPTVIKNETGKLIWDGRGKAWRVNNVNNDWNIMNFEKITSPFDFIYKN